MSLDGGRKGSIMSSIEYLCSLESVLETLAFHVATAMTDSPNVGHVLHSGCGLSADPGDPDAPSVLVQYEIDRCDGHERIWDRCRVHRGGIWVSVGNRCGLRAHIVQAYAPIIAERARRDAERAAA